MDKTVNCVKNNNLCLGCGACYSVCPSSSIKMVLNRDVGNYVPQIDKNRCTNCGLCKEICPSLNFNIENNCLKKEFEYYVAKSKDEKISSNASSGGVITSFLIYLINNNIIDSALLVRNDSVKPYPIYAKNEKEILACMGSKYCPVPIVSKLKEITKSKFKKIVVVGLPCHIQAIKNIKEKSSILKDKELIYLGLFCSRLPSFKATDYLLKNLLKIESKDVKKINYRKGYIAEITLKDGKIINIPYKNYWNSNFKYLINRRCLFCYDRINELADISFGDFWLDKQNIVIIRNKKIGSILKQSGVVNMKLVERNKAYFYLRKSINSKKNLLSAKVKLLNERNLKIKKARKSRLIDYIYSFLYIFRFKVANLFYKKDSL